MSDSSSNYEVKVTTIGQPAGSDAVAKSLQGVSKAAAATGKESKSLASDLETLGSRNNAAKDIIEGFEMAMKGGTNAIFGLAKGVKNLFDVLGASTPIGKIALLATAAAGAFGVLRGKLGGTAESVEKANALFDLAVARLEKLNNAKLDGLRDQIIAIKDSGESALKVIDALQAARDKIDNAEMAALLAENAADASQSPEQKTQTEARIRRDFAERKRQGDEVTRTQKESALTATRDELSGRERETAAALNEQKRLVAAANARREFVASRQGEIYRELASGAGVENIDAANITPEQQAAIDRRLALGREQTALKNESAALSSPAGQAADKVNEAELQARAARQAAAYAEYAAAEKKLADVQQTNLIERATVELTRGPELREYTAKDAVAQRATDRADLGQLADAKTNADRASLGTVVADARRIGERARAAFQPEVFTYDKGISGDRNKANREGIEQRNAARTQTFAAATTAIEKITGQLGDGKEEAKELADLSGAIQNLAAATQTTNSATIRDLTRRISTLEQQAKNGNR